jgi:hypothetical protein
MPKPNRAYIATIKLIIDADTQAQATREIQHLLNNKLAIIDWGFAGHPGLPYRMPLIAMRAFPCEIELPELYCEVKAQIARLIHQRFTTPATAAELRELEMAYEDTFDQLGSQLHQGN